MNQKDTDEIAAVRTETQRALRRGAYFWAIMILTVVLSAGSSILATRILTDRSARKLCAVVILTDDNYRRNPPQSVVLKQQAANFAKLRKELGCAPFQGE